MGRGELNDKSLLVLATWGAVIAVCMSRPLSAQSAAYDGNKSCRVCHNGLNPQYFQDFVTLHESALFRPAAPNLPNNPKPIFQGVDKHVDAFRQLMTRRGADITDALKLTNSSKYEALGSRDHINDLRNNAQRECLSCHANWRADITSQNYKQFVEEGVSCEACHGPATLWKSDHEKAEWRAVPVNDDVQKPLPDRFKETKAENMTIKEIKSKQALGMVDVRNPVERAKQCLSCHVGDFKQGKVVTHEMYALGHPPLPSFALETFATAMPRHWRYLSEKGEFEYKLDYLLASGLVGANELTEEKMTELATDLPRTKATLVGGLMVLRQVSNMLAEQAKQAEMQGQENQWPQLAMYDCQSCHHELRAPSWRQQRGYSGSPPGRMYAPAWSEALVKAAVWQLPGSESKYAALEAKLNALRAAFDGQPFGAPGQVAPAADAVVKLIDDYAGELSKRVVNRSVADSAIDFLCQPDHVGTPDYHAARQIAWAIMVMETELSESNHKPEGLSVIGVQRMKVGDNLEETETERLARGQTDVKAFIDYRKKLLEHEKKYLTGFDESVFPELRLRLPAGEASIEDEFPLVLQAISRYDPSTFLEQLKDFQARRNSKE